jgi:hypothetical protein
VWKPNRGRGWRSTTRGDACAQGSWRVEASSARLICHSSISTRRLACWLLARAAWLIQMQRFRKLTKSVHAPRRIVMQQTCTVHAHVNR